MLTIRPAQITDLAALCLIRYTDQPAIHRDRINASDNKTYCYLVAEHNDRLVGFGVLLIERPQQWSDLLETFPIVVDLFVVPESQGQGIGSAMLKQMETIACQYNKKTLCLNVEPQTNARALALYQRLGFKALQDNAYRIVWQFTDSEGAEHAGEEWVIDMCKSLEDVAS